MKPHRILSKTVAADHELTFLLFGLSATPTRVLNAKLLSGGNLVEYDRNLKERSMKNLRTGANPTALDQRQNHEPAASKRKLLKTAWVAPVIVALNLPRSGYAANMSGTTKHGGWHHGRDNNGKHQGKD